MSIRFPVLSRQFYIILILGKLVYPNVSYFWQFIKTIAWNCQGLGNFYKPETYSSLHDLLNRENQDIIFISETKQQTDNVEKILRKINVHNYWIVPPRGTAGGLILAWKDNVNLTILDYTDNQINARVFDQTINSHWIFTGFYGIPYRPNKIDSWNMKRSMASTITEPWIIIGDCNIMLHESEKQSRFPFNQSEANNFIELLHSLDLHDLGFTGYPFTWNNRRNDNDFTEQRLDRALANNELLNIFPNSNLTHLDPLISDQVPICLSTYVNWHDGAKPFKYFGPWMNPPQCKTIIDNAWTTNTNGSAAYCYTRKLKSVKHSLNRWNKETFGNINTNITNIKQKLDEANQNLTSNTKAREMKKLTLELTKWYNTKEEFWKIKSKKQHLALGDRNTQFFHDSARQRYRRNKIDTIRDQHGNWLQEKRDIANCLSQHFKTIATTVNPSMDEDLIDLIPTSLNDMDNRFLESSPTDIEIRNTLFAMEPNKSPGPDGFPPAFFQKKLGHNWT